MRKIAALLTFSAMMYGCEIDGLYLADGVYYFDGRLPFNNCGGHELEKISNTIDLQHRLLESEGYLRAWPIIGGLSLCIVGDVPGIVYQGVDTPLAGAYVPDYADLGHVLFISIGYAEDLNWASVPDNYDFRKTFAHEFFAALAISGNLTLAPSPNLDDLPAYETEMVHTPEYLHHMQEVFEALRPDHQVVP